MGARFRSAIEGGRAVSSSDAEQIFRQASASELASEPSWSGGFGGLGSRPQTSGSMESTRLSQHEFVLAVLQLGHARYRDTSSVDSDDPAPLAKSLDLLMDRHIGPHATFEVFDEMSRAVKQLSLIHI